MCAMQAASVERSVCWEAIVGIFASSRDREMLAHVDLLRASALNEQELWREMVRWSGGRIVEERGVLLVSGPSSYLRVAIRYRSACRRGHGAGSGHRVLRAPASSSSCGDPTTRTSSAPRWRQGSARVDRTDDGAQRPPAPGVTPDDIEVRVVEDSAAVVDYGRVVALANDDPGERERAPLLFHDETIIAPHIAAFVAYLGESPSRAR